MKLLLKPDLKGSISKAQNVFLVFLSYFFIFLLDYRFFWGSVVMMNPTIL